MRFFQFLELGLWHIADLNAYDHILFIVVACVMFHIREWKKVLILITAFTLGHSLTLALAVSKWIQIDKDFVELLIPITILLTAIWNILPFGKNQNENKAWFSFNYLIVLFFGLIHGLGFSNYLGMLLGRNESMVAPLLGFNIGVELGQLLIVFIFMLISFVFLELLKVKMKHWTFTVSTFAILVSLYLISQTDFIAQ